MTEQEERARVVEIARSWIGTPFHDMAGLKGVGVDCAHLLKCVFVEAGLVETFKIEPYSAQFMLHRDTPLFEGYVERFAHEIDESDVKPGDVVLYQVGRSFAHGGIVVAWPDAIIHAFKSFRCVAETSSTEADLAGRKTKFYSRW